MRSVRRRRKAAPDAPKAGDDDDQDRDSRRLAGVARSSADWSPLAARADLAFFADAFGSEDEAAAALADFDILLTMRERTAFPETLLRRLPKLRMIGITGASVATLDLAACSRQGIVVCNTAGGGGGAPFATAELALGLLIAAARAIPAADAAMRAGGFQRGRAGRA